LADEAVQPVIVDPQMQPIADPAGRHRVEHLARDKSAAGGHPHAGRVMIGGTPRRQSAQRGPLEADRLLAPGVTATDEVGDPVAIGVKAVALGAAAQQQGLADDAPEVAVLAFDGTVFVRDPPIITGRLHAVVSAERFIATGLVLDGGLVEVAERRRKAVGARLGWAAAERPQRILQAAGQRGETLAAEPHFGMLPGGIRQDKVIEAVCERLTGDADAEIHPVGEIRQARLTRWMILAEDHLALSAVLGAPGADATLQRAAQTIPVAIGVASLHCLQQRHRSHAGTVGQQRQDVALPQAAKRVDDLSSQRSLGIAFWEARRGSASIRRPVRALMPVLAAAMRWGWWQRRSMYSLICWSVAGRPGTSDLFLQVEVPILPASAATRGRGKTRAAGLVGLGLGDARPAADQTGQPTCR
jgi:hypothetical protein